MIYTVNKPSVWLYKTDDLMGEVSDELLLGTVMDLLSENDVIAYVKTSYGYCGYVNRWDIEELEENNRLFSDGVYVRYGCDLLYEPQYLRQPAMSIPRGSRLVIGEKVDKRFWECFVGKKRFFIPDFAICKKNYESLGAAICKNAAEYIGTAYRWGGKSNSGIDCSGLVFMSCMLSGVSICRDSQIDKNYVFEISEKDVKPGDLAYFQGHVAVLTGKDTFIHASASKCMVLEDSFGNGLSKNDVKMLARVKNKAADI